MIELRGLPPGRAGRLWLRRRLATAERGATLLDRKLRVLRGEQERLRGVVEQTGAAWAAACHTANLWLVRAAMLGGQREIRLAISGAPATATLTWKAVMGVSCPDGSEVVVADSPARGGGTSALGEAASAYRLAVDAAVAHAAAAGALRAVEAEINTTFRRLRAISEHWIPRLQEALAELTQRLEETERDETARMRWALPAG